MHGQTNDKILSTKLPQRRRKEPTEAEKALWRAVRDRQLSGCKFRREHPFESYILDFVCLEKKLVVELDGSQHEEQKEYDERRTQRLQVAGLRVLRFSDREVLRDMDAVKERIWLALQEHRDPSPPRPST